MKRRSPSLQKSLLRYRGRIDQLDARILDLLSRRALVVEQVGSRKREHGAGIYDPGREKAIFQKLRRANRGPLTGEAVERIFRAVVGECRAHERDTAPMVVRKGEPISVSIVGLGLIGGSLARALRRHAPQFKVVGYDRRARKSRALHRRASSFAEVARSKIVILAVPVGEILEILRSHAGDFAPGTIVMDAGSTKKEICALAARVLPPDVFFVGGHPLSGKSVAQGGQPDPELFRGRPFVLCPPVKRPSGGSKAAFAAVRALVEQIGALPMVMDPATHDQVLAVTSHLPQMASTALALAAADALRKSPLVYGPAFVQMTRFASSDYRMWRDIARTNRENLLRAIGGYASSLRQIERAVRSGDLAESFRKGARFRESMGEQK